MPVMSKRRRLTGKQPAPYKIYVEAQDWREDERDATYMTLYVNGNQTVRSVKDMIEQHLGFHNPCINLWTYYRPAGIRYNMQSYVYDGRLLEDDNTIAQTSVTEYSIVVSEYRERDIQIIIQKLNGSRINLNVRRRGSVSGAKDRLADVLDTHPCQQQFVFDGVLLNNDETLVHYGREIGSVVNLIMGPD